MDEALPPEDALLDSPQDLTPLDGLGDLGLGGAPSPIEKHSDLLKELTNFDPIIQRRIRNWLGLQWDEKKESYEPKHSAIINEKGARWAIGFLQTYQTKTNIITNISEIEFKNLQHEIIDVVWLNFPTNEDFDVVNNNDWHRLCTELQHSAFLVLAGAGDGKYTKFLGESVTRTENVQVTPTPARRAEGENWMSGLKRAMLGRK